MSGPARMEIDCQPPHVRSDSKAILEILMAAFAEVVPVREAEMSFLGSHQKQSESLRASHIDYSMNMRWPPSNSEENGLSLLEKKGSGTNLFMGSLTLDSDGSCLNLLNRSLKNI